MRAQPEDTDPAAAHGDHPPIKGKLPAGLRIGRPDAGFGAQQGFFAGRLHIEIGRHFGEVGAIEGLELPGIRHAGRLFTSRQFPKLTDQAEDDFIIGLFQGNEITLVEVIQEWLLFGLNPSGFSGQDSGEFAQVEHEKHQRRKFGGQKFFHGGKGGLRRSLDLDFVDFGKVVLRKEFVEFHVGFTYSHPLYGSIQGDNQPYSGTLLPFACLLELVAI